MKHTSVVVYLNPRKFKIDVCRVKRGYACRVAGLPMVVHKDIIIGADDLPALAARGWSVTEPRCGLKLSYRCATRQDAISMAEGCLKRNGGVPALEKEVKQILIKRKLRRQDG